MGGTLSASALILDGQEYEVQLAYEGIPVGIFFIQDPQNPILYTFIYDLHNSTKKSQVLLDIMTDGSIAWPYLVVKEPVITPTPTPTIKPSNTPTQTQVTPFTNTATSTNTGTPSPTPTITSLATITVTPHSYHCSEDHPNYTVGLIKCQTGCFEGYTLFAPIASQNTYLIDMLGREINTWTSNYLPGQSVYLLEDGSLLRTIATNNPYYNVGGTGGGIQIYDWNGILQWDYRYSSNTYHSHHDVEILPNGNVLLIAWERISERDAINSGRDPTFLPDGVLWSEKIVEVQPQGLNSGQIVWEWRVWDHLVQNYDASKQNYGIVRAHSELINVNYFLNDRRDWLHINAIDYHENFDQIMLSVHNFSEIWIIDHSTTKIESAAHTGGRRGKGGDLLYRWGNPEAYDAGTTNDSKLYLQHDAHWIKQGLNGEGNILLFNNGTRRPGGNYSTVNEFSPQVDASGDYPVPTPGLPFDPNDFTWTYQASISSSFYSATVSGAQRLPNGNTLICEGDNGVFFEVSQHSHIYWKYINPVGRNGPIYQGNIPRGNTVFRAYRYSIDNSAFVGKCMTPGDVIELY